MTILTPNGQPVTAVQKDAPPQKQYLGLIGSELVSVQEPNGLLFTQYFTAQAQGRSGPVNIPCGRFMYATKVALQENIVVVMSASDNGAPLSQMNVVLTQSALKDYIAALAELITEPTEVHLLPKQAPDGMSEPAKATPVQQEN